MCTARAASAALLVVALSCGTARADDTRKSAPQPPPDPGFLEFLGGVDGLAEVNPDYLAQANHPGPAAPKPPAPPPAPQAPASVPGAKGNE
jgi:hypothetical protein